MYIIIYDFGTSSVKTCLFEIDSRIRLAASASATFLYDTRKGKEGWNKGLLKMYKVNSDHMPEIIDCTEMAGRLTQRGGCAGTVASACKA